MTPPEPQAGMGRAPASEESILAGARRVLNRHGWQRTTVEQIADEAGISRVTLHRRGLTKDVILARLAEQATERYRDAMWPVLTAPEPAGDRLTAALRVLCDLAEENLGLLLALDAQASAQIFHAAGTGEVLTRDVYTEPLERLLRDGLNEGSVRTVSDPTQTATVLFNLVGWTYIHLRSGHGWRPERARDGILDLALHGLLTT